MKFAKNNDLEELELGQRPIIFIVHSMGGLVAKQAYIIGQHDHQFSDIVSSIRAIMFLATPHRGSNLAEILNRILTVSFFHSPKLYISELSTGSQTVAALNEQFRHLASKLEIISFYETLQTSYGPKKMMVVGKDSATLGYQMEISNPLNADHHTVCKFKSNLDSNYICVRNALKTLVSSIREKGKKIAHGLTGSEPSSQFQIPINTTLICEWIRFNPLFADWMDEVNPTLDLIWIHAPPASGKSVLSASVAHQLSRERLCVYYFFRFSDNSQHSLGCCLRGIAFQLADQLPSFRQALERVSSSSQTLEKTDVKIIWDRVFVQILFKMRLSAMIYWIIDALDESDDPQLLLYLIQGISNSNTPIKVLLVSRYTSVIITAVDRLSSLLSVSCLPFEEVKNDIMLFVEREVQYMRTTTKVKMELVNKMVKGANGNFLWASLAMKEVIECNTEKDIDDTLSGIPRGMEGLYQ
ncbi:Cytochrome cd1-nitrite reductase-like C-terminal heme d1 [Penicillium malachiteum]|uniref:Cytochrome cd1-nitrite reductase-like C-terminal heme d1 n=1 Tax=Penicillium malachiteum TaxID=1324776 RepID=A0AAD6HGL7_9EURO|nr:Cytochrome cd1-nitrite reductase-like C-terminal heme d1 [Penicillium malachiteum]